MRRSVALRLMQAAQMPVGVSCLCPGWVKTGIVDSDRNWPAELGELPPRDIAQEIQIGHVRRAIDAKPGHSVIGVSLVLSRGRLVLVADTAVHDMEEGKAIKPILRMPA